MLDNKIAIIGLSGHALVVTEAAKLIGMNISFYTDLEFSLINPYSLEYLGCETDESFDHWCSDISFILGIGNNEIRKRTFKLVKEKGSEVLSVIHPSASISEFVDIGLGSFIAKMWRLIL